MSKSSPFRPLCCPDRKRICKQDPGHGLHIVRGRCIVHKSLFRSHFGAIMPDFPRTRIGTEAPTATQQATFGHKNTDTDACLGRNADERILSQSIQIAFTKPNNQLQLHSHSNQPAWSPLWLVFGFFPNRNSTFNRKQDGFGSCEELSALMPAELWHHLLFNFPSWECCRDNHNHELYNLKN